ncbi:MAG: DUF2071 domain-containing protein [Ginsengibacter sp.]
MKSYLLHAAWNNLIIANYAVPHEILLPYLPHKTELDSFRGETLVSLVGLMFLNTKIKGFVVPYHINFEEVNLRFYVKHSEKGNTIRGVTFIKEIVPKLAITLVAKHLYRERYVTMKMKHFHSETEAGLETEYQWKYKEDWNRIGVLSEKKSVPLRIGSEEEFITENYWGFTKVNDTKTSVYEVEHPRWDIFPVTDYTIDCNFKALYGEEFAFLKDAKPSSVIVTKGSEVKIFSKRLL